MTAEAWTFATIRGDRLRGLEAAPPFEEIAASIRDTMTVLCCHRDPCGEDNRFRRPVYTVEVAEGLFDQFFNSRHGYRAAYLGNPYEGLRANGLLLKNVAPLLVASAVTAACSESVAFIEDSLLSISAKAWLTEAEKGRCDICLGQWKASDVAAGEIRNGRWSPGTVYGDWGTSAPRLTQIKFMGAFLDDRRNELITWDKRHRSEEIHLRGWS
jgi:hypothetical protein